MTISPTVYIKGTVPLFFKMAEFPFSIGFLFIKELKKRPITN